MTNTAECIYQSCLHEIQIMVAGYDLRNCFVMVTIYHWCGIFVKKKSVFSQDWVNKLVIICEWNWKNQPPPVQPVLDQFLTRYSFIFLKTCAGSWGLLLSGEGGAHLFKLEFATKFMKHNFTERLGSHKNKKSCSLYSYKPSLPLCVCVWLTHSLHFSTKDGLTEFKFVFSSNFWKADIALEGWTVYIHLLLLVMSSHSFGARLNQTNTD